MKRIFLAAIIATFAAGTAFAQDMSCETKAVSKEGKPLACAGSGEWRHPVVGLWPLALRDSLRTALVDERLRKIDVWTARHGVAVAAWPADPVDPFLNVNTPKDAEAAARIALQHHGL